MADHACASSVTDGRRRGTLGALGAVALTLAACGSTSPSVGGGADAPAPVSATVKTATTSRGTILVNSNGMALYVYGPDHGAALSTCRGTCLQQWPPLTVAARSTPTAGAGVTGTLGTAPQPDGILQVTYNGNLLYLFLSDTTSGRAAGDGVAGFSVATVSTPAAAAPAPSSSSTSTTSARYGY